MRAPPTFLMADPGCFEVAYRINPWMRPSAWNPELRPRAIAASRALGAALARAGARVETIGAEPGLPDLVFTANAAVVLDGQVLLARFRHPERQGEEAPFRAAFEVLKARGRVRRIAELPAGLFHEGAGDALWDPARGLFWTGHGQRSDLAAGAAIAGVFDRPVIALELAAPRFYHLDTCFRPLSGGEVLYYPPAFTAEALARIEARVAPRERIVATDADAAAFCVNAVCLGRTIVMARAPAGLRGRLEARGYAVVEIDLSPFILAGGAAFCLTLRLDQQSHPALAAA
jgi:N-dimethylarginine dimethylaminohydrolase